MLNNFCFHLYAQKSLFIAENWNAFFDIHTKVCHKIEKLPILHGPMILLCNFVMRSQIKKPFLKRLIFT